MLALAGFAFNVLVLKTLTEIGYEQYGLYFTYFKGILPSLVYTISLGIFLTIQRVMLRYPTDEEERLKGIVYPAYIALSAAVACIVSVLSLVVPGLLPFPRPSFFYISFVLSSFSITEYLLIFYTNAAFRRIHVPLTLQIFANMIYLATNYLFGILPTFFRVVVLYSIRSVTYTAYLIRAPLLQFGRGFTDISDLIAKFRDEWRNFALQNYISGLFLTWSKGLVPYILSLGSLQYPAVYGVAMSLFSPISYVNRIVAENSVREIRERGGLGRRFLMSLALVGIFVGSVLLLVSHPILEFFFPGTKFGLTDYVVLVFTLLVLFMQLGSVWIHKANYVLKEKQHVLRLMISDVFLGVTYLIVYLFAAVLSKRFLLITLLLLTIPFVADVAIATYNYYIILRTRNIRHEDTKR